jgi:ribosome assembly protein 1
VLIIGRHLRGHRENAIQEGHPDVSSRLMRDFESNLETGFQVATLQGPLCAEPVQGIAYFVEKFEVNDQAAHGEDGEL